MTPSVTQAEAQRDVATLQRLPCVLHSLPAAADERLDLHRGLDRMLSLGYITWSFSSYLIGITPAGRDALARATEGGWSNGILTNALSLYPVLLRERRAS